MALVALSTVFMLREKARNKETHPLLSYRDITELLDYYLPRRSRDEDDVHARIEARHKARQRDLDRKKHRKTGLPSPQNLHLTK